MNATHESAAMTKTTLGFWIYILTDCIIFACLFATFAVLRGNTFGGPGGQEIINLPFVLIETLLLLTSSFTSGVALWAAHQKLKRVSIYALLLTLLLGGTFLALELYEFRMLIHEGWTWQVSAYLSSYFTLVGTHGLHIVAGLLWGASIVIMMLRRGLDESNVRKLGLFSIFWHFLDIIWIFIFSIVYLLGVRS